PPAACAITSTTTLSAPDGSPDTRRTVGVREEVTFTVTGSADWKASSGDPTTSKAASSSFVWRAPRRGERPTIAASIVAAPVSCAFQMEVVEPASLAMTKISEDAFPKGQQGAGMICDATFAPTSVSFAQVEWLEI